MRWAYAIVSGRLSPSGIFKELLAGTRRGAKTARSDSGGGGGGGGWVGRRRRDHKGHKESRRRTDPEHSANMQLRVGDD